MEQYNETQVTSFILLGFSYRASTKIVLFLVLLVVYLLSLSANSLFIIVTLADTRLHSPMYFFLCNLSFLDLCFSSFIAPTVLEGLLVQKITILYAACVTQMYITLSLGVTECFLLVVMAWDRYVAICRPLHYQHIMTNRVCIKLAIITWTSGMLIALPNVVMIPFVHLCGHNIIDHTFCEQTALSRLTCRDKQFEELSTPFVSLLSLLVPLSLILFTYCRIISAILRMATAESRRRTFATCGSHLVVVTLFYGTAMGMYFKPKSSVSPEIDKPFSLFYGQVVPALNPLVYTLRNNEVKGALGKLYSRSICRKMSKVTGIT